MLSSIGTIRSRFARPSHTMKPSQRRAKHISWTFEARSDDFTIGSKS